MRSNLIDINVRLVTETEKAFLVEVEDRIESHKVWLPKSQCELVADTKHSTCYVLTLPESMAYEKGLI